ncbi:hypothetical protein KBC80_03770 [Candidatus Woesebacteria bacterium]|nr:hypothetical protein [Candidatus Woesebacteria bacterium]
MTTTLLLIQRQSLQLFISNRVTPLAIMVPESVMHDMEIINEQGLATLFKQILPIADIHQQSQITLVISEDLCFIAPYDVEHSEEVIVKLQNESPFAHVAIAKVLTQVTPVIVSTNQELYETIGRVLEASGYTVLGVYPWRALQLGEMAKPNAVFDIAAARRFCESLPTYKGAAFEYKTTVPYVAPVLTATGVPIKKKLSVGWLVFGTVALLYAAVMFYIMFR